MLVPTPTELSSQDLHRQGREATGFTVNGGSAKGRQRKGVQEQILL